MFRKPNTSGSRQHPKSPPKASAWLGALPALRTPARGLPEPTRGWGSPPRRVAEVGRGGQGGRWGLTAGATRVGALRPGRPRREPAVHRATHHAPTARLHGLLQAKLRDRRRRRRQPPRDPSTPATSRHSWAPCRGNENRQRPRWDTGIAAYRELSQGCNG